MASGTTEENLKTGSLELDDITTLETALEEAFKLTPSNEPEEASELTPSNEPDKKPLAKLLCSALRASADVEKTLSIVLQDETGFYSPDTVRQVEMLDSIYRLAEHDVGLTVNVWQKKPADLHELAKSHYYTLPDNWPKSEEWKANLFSLKPTSVILGLVVNKKIKMPGKASPNATELATQCLEMAIQNGFDIRRKSARQMLKEVFPKLPGTSEKAIIDEDKKQISEFIFALQRLQALVRNPEHIGLLLKADYKSAHDIVRDEEDNVFEETMGGEDMPADAARRILDHALKVEIRNEQAWANALIERNAVTLPYVTVNSKTEVSVSQQRGAFDSADVINLTNVFRDMDSMECSDCNSVLSPSAYFVDLLQLLQETYSSRGDKKSPSLFDKLKERRPDLEKLELSCANTKTQIAYIDLVNEVMESYVDYLSGREGASEVSILVHNTPADESGNAVDPASQPRHVNFGIYQKLLQAEVYPLTVFPYNQAIDTIRSLLQAANSSRYELMSTFSSNDMSLYHIKAPREKTWSSEVIAGMRKHIPAVINRAQVAEYLGLQQEDFMAITNEAFYSFEVLQEQRGHSSAISVDEYLKHFSIRSAETLWGYKETKGIAAKDLMLDEVNGDGLTFIKNQLLARSSLSIKELQEILKAQLFCQRLVITTRNALNEFTGKLDDMRLRCTTLQNENSGTLTEDLCFDLQAFIRLWRKTGWSISELDAILSTLKRTNKRSHERPFFPASEKTAEHLKPDFQCQTASIITPDMLEDLAAVKKLTEITRLEPSVLQPLWADIDTNGKNSLYEKLFLQPRMTKMDPVFKTKKEGIYLKSDFKIMFGQHTPVILATLRILEKDLPVLFASSGLALEPELTLQSISAVYRTSLFYSMLGIEPGEFPAFRRLFPAEDFYESPQTTLRVLDQWKSLQNRGWMLQDLSSNKEDGVADETQSLVFKAIKKMLSGVAAIDKLYISPSQGQNAMEDVGKINPLLFGSAKANLVTKFIEGKWSTSSSVTFENDLTKNPIPIELASKLSFQIDFMQPKNAKVTMTGLLSEVELKSAKALVDQKNTAWSEALDSMNSKAQEVFGILANKVYPNKKEYAEMTFTDTKEEALISKRKDFLEHALPILKSQQLRQNILDSVSVDFPIDAALFLPLLTEIVRTGDGKTAMESLLSISDPVAASVTASTKFQGHFLPTASGDYYFSSESKNAPSLKINGIEVQFSQISGVWKSGKEKLLSGRSYKVEYAPDGLSYTAPTSLVSSQFTSETLVSEHILDTVKEVYSKLRVAARMIQVYQLNLQEIEYFVSAKADLRINLVTADVQQLLRLGEYTIVRDACSAAQKSGETIISLFEWAKKEQPDNKQLCSLIGSATGWSAKQVANILQAKYIGREEQEWPALFCNEKELFQMNKIIALITRLNLPTMEVVKLFEIAAPSPIPQVLPETGNDLNFETAGDLRLSVQALDSGLLPSFVAANDQIRERQRTALIQYLLNHSKIKELKLYDADGLFEWFLIDVQMGAKLQTSRMRQAISTIQLYVQRCMLGLEKPMGVDCETVSRIRWKYMSKYTLWEANRKLFLYPENWIDPTLRDNKTELFKALEVAILQSNLNEETINAAIKAYIYGANDIAELSIQSYIWEKKDEYTGVFHFFARTRQTPYQYYYRSLKFTFVNSTTTETVATDVSLPSTTTSSANVTSNSEKSEVQMVRKWTSWTRIDVDIPSLETDVNGNSLKQPGSYLVPIVSRGRIFLFIPQFLVKSPTEDKDDTPMTQRAERKQNLRVEKYWEIKLGRSELRNGKWTPKQTFSSYLQVPGSPAEDNFVPSVSSFKFVSSTYSSSSSKHINPNTDDVIFIDVECWYNHLTSKGDKIPTKVLNADAETKRLTIGRFKVQETKVTAIHLSDLPALVVRKDNEKAEYEQDDNAVEAERFGLTDNLNDRTIPTYFSKIFAQSISQEFPQLFPIVRRGGNQYQVMLAKISGKTVAQRDYLWTLSLNTDYIQKPTGLVLEVLTRTKTSTYLAVPTDNAADYVDRLENLDHLLSSELMERSTTSEKIDSVYQFLSTIKDSALIKTSFGGLETGFSEQATPYSIYNWELGMHAISLIMERLLATQQFELALSMARLVFDPTIDGTNLERCWRFLPFRDTATIGAHSVLDILNKLDAQKKDMIRSAEEPIMEWKENPFVAHAVARGRPVVYMKRFVLKYIEILVASGDHYFRQNSLESIPLALQRYVEASHLFGPPPKQVPKLGKLSVKTFANLKDDLDVFSNAKVDMELDFPFSDEPRYRGVLIPEDQREISSMKPKPLHNMVKTGYFCVPPNPQVTALRSLIDDRFYKIRNSLDINGKPLTLALFDPPLDPGVLAKVEALGLSPSTLLNDLEAPMPNYRFLYLLQKAMDMCTELKSLGEQFLSAKEKKDVEGLSLLHARQDLLTNTTLLPIKELQKTEVTKSILALEETRKSHVNRLGYYLALIGESAQKIPDENSEWTDIVQSIDKPTSDDLKMSPYEQVDMDKSESAAKLTDGASVLELAASGLMALPNLTSNMQPMGVGVQLKIDAENAAKFMQGVSSFMKLKAQMDSHDAQRASRKGGMVKQLQERRLQANQAGHDVKHVDREIAVQRVRLAVCESEIRAQQLQIDRANEIQEWYRTKYTNEALYAWLENSFRTLYYDSFMLTMQLARRAERAFQFDNPSRRNDKFSYLSQGGYWDSGRDGLLSAQHLYLSLKRLELAYVENRSHDYELVKNVSLRQIDPLSLMALRQNGETQFSLPEILFDLDFPGHYMRRIKSVSVTIPCVVGPYTGLNCILSLIEHRMRINPGLPYNDQGRDDPRFHTDRIPISSIAVTSGQQDSGVFELSFHDERYLPFEGAGAISKWKLEFPSAIKQFNYSTISDVVLHIRYTTIDGGAALRKSANDTVQKAMKEVQEADKMNGGFHAFLDLKHDYPQEWYEFQQSGYKKMQFAGLPDRLPFWTRGETLKIHGTTLMISKQSTDWKDQVHINAKIGTELNPIEMKFAITDDVKIKDVSVLHVSAKEEAHADKITADACFTITLEDGTKTPDNVYFIFNYVII